MVLNKNKDLKMFYSISEVAEMFHVQPTLLRYWETQFPQIIPKKTSRNFRQYTKENIEQIGIIYDLVKVKGMKLEAAAKLLRKNKEGVEKKKDVVDTLKEVLEELRSMKATLNDLY